MSSQKKWHLQLGALALLVTAFAPGCARLSQPVSSAGLVKVLSGHSSWVNSVAWAPDGLKLASGSSDRTVRVWDVTTGTTITTLTGFQGAVNAVAWSPDGKYLATGSSEHSGGLRVWDTTSWGPAFTIDPTLNAPNDADLNSLAWSPDGMQLAVGLQGSTTKGIPVTSWVKIYTTASWKNTATLTYPEGVGSVTWSPKSPYVAFASSFYDYATKGRVVLWDPKGSPARDTTVVRFPAQDGLLTAIAWAPDGRRIVGNALHLSTAGGFELKVWDVPGQQNTTNLSGAAETIQSVAWSADGMYIAAGATDRTLTLWAASSGQHVASYHAGDSINSVAWSPVGSQVAAGSADANIYIWAAPPPPAGPTAGRSP